jgi:hypothetical protein
MTDKNTFVVSISKSLNNFSVLGCRIATPYGEVVFHDSPVLNMRGTELLTNFDIAIMSSIDDWATSLKFLPKHMGVIAPRHSKFEQAMELIEWSNTYTGIEESDFKLIPTWLIDQGDQFNHVLPGKYVIKPNHGARGIGQMKIDTNRASMSDVCSLIVYHENEDDFRKSIEIYGDAVQFAQGKENHPGEGYKVLRSQTAVVQTAIKIKNEYRVITDARGMPKYYQLRTRQLNGDLGAHLQATGSGGLGNLTDADDVFRNIRQLNAFENLCSTVIGPLKSIDLFTAPDGTWGVIEYCNQFGTTGIPQPVNYKLHYDYIVSLVKRYVIATKPSK